MIDTAPNAVAKFVDAAQTELRMSADVVETEGVKERVAGSNTAVAITELAQRGFNTFVERLNQKATWVNESDSKADLEIGDDAWPFPIPLVKASGMAENGWVPVDQRTLETPYPGVYAVGDIAFTKTPKAGVFAEGAARVVAA